MALKMNKGDLADIAKALLFSVLFSIAFVMIFAVIVKFADVSESVIVPVNIAIKIVSVLLGVLLGFKHPRAGFVKGFVVGLLFAAATYLIFSAINGSFTADAMTAFDILGAVAAGVISGILTVNVKAGRARRA